MTETFSTELYPKEVIIKTACSMIDKCYVHLDLIDNKYCLQITSKDSESDSDIKKRLDNEIIFQLARYTVSVRTSDIRQLIMGRAFATSMIAEKRKIPDYDCNYVSSADAILKDWFEANGKQ